MATPSIASRAPDAALDAASRPDNTSCCSILVKTALTVAVVAAAAIAMSVTLTCASPLVGLAILCVSLPIAAIFLSATWAGTGSYVSYSRPRAYAPLYTRTPSPLFYQASRRPIFTEPAPPFHFIPPARAQRAGLALAARPASLVAPHIAVGSRFGGVVLPSGAARAASDAGHVGVGSGRRR